MFNPSDKPRIFALPPGIDFAQSLIRGLIERTQNLSPEALARTTIYVNGRRMQSQIRDIFHAGPARLLPRVHLISDLAHDPVIADLPPEVAPLRRRLELSQLISKLLDAQPGLAPRSALYDLSDSLAKIIAEMHNENVPPERIETLDITDSSGHWARTKAFFEIIRPLFDPTMQPDAEARQRQAVERLAKQWADAPPSDPIIVAGSTGSRGTTALLIQAVSALPQGAVVLPGFDRHLPDHVWEAMGDRRRNEDHPQFRFKLLMDRLSIGPDDITDWTGVREPAPARNRVISLALRPVPVTNQWQSEGPQLGDLPAAMQNVTLIEAPGPRAEAEAVALLIRDQVARGRSTVLITPDRMLTRHVATVLDQWGIIPDDSAGRPLHLSATGRLLRYISALRAEPVTGERLISLLKHPLTAGGSNRVVHLQMCRAYELHLRRKGPAYPAAEDLIQWAQTEDQVKWAQWVGGLLETALNTPSNEIALGDHIQAHTDLAIGFATGPEPTQKHKLWDHDDGREALKTMTEFQNSADTGGALNAFDYHAMVSSVLQSRVVRPLAHNPFGVLFTGTVEARVQLADLVILGGLNESSWPRTPEPDPWLNRDMRAQAGLLLPERRIGLSAHDFQQAAGAQNICITRAIRSDEAETVPSRWLNRLCNLLSGLPDQGGPEALRMMRASGQKWLDMAVAMNRPAKTEPPAPRPSPRPPRTARPKTISVTEIKTLIRDPYAIYAKRILGLKKLPPLVPQADAPLKGNIIHKILEIFLKSTPDLESIDSKSALLAIARAEFARDCPWPMMQRLWLAQFENAADWFLQTEAERQAKGTPRYFETWAELHIAALDMTINGKADRIDITPSNEAILYDYKTGQVPTEKQQIHFDKQLIIEAALIARGAFKDIGAKHAVEAAFIGVNAQKVTPAPFEDAPPEDEWQRFIELLKLWQDIGRGYTARMAAEKNARASDFDHLSRFGEWDVSQPPVPEDLT